MKKTFVLGKIDYYGTGRKINRAELDVSWDGKNFATCARVWNGRATDIIIGGQCVEEVVRFFPDNKFAQRVHAVWKDWHLNDVKSGSPDQEAWLKANPVTWEYPESYYDVASRALEKAGLNPDPNYIHNGKPYRYGSAWLKREIPPEITAEIESWFKE